MPEEDVCAIIRKLANRDGRYAFNAFLFVSDAISCTVQWLRDGSLPRNDQAGQNNNADTPPDPGPPPPPETPESASTPDSVHHVSGQELLAGCLRLARERWGFMADHVLASWGVRRSEDVGEIVFLMVEDPDLPWRKRPCDSRADFANGPDFRQAFAVWD